MARPAIAQASQLFLHNVRYIEANIAATPDCVLQAALAQSSPCCYGSVNDLRDKLQTDTTTLLLVDRPIQAAFLYAKPLVLLHSAKRLLPRGKYYYLKQRFQAVAEEVKESQRLRYGAPVVLPGVPETALNKSVTSRPVLLNQALHWVRFSFYRVDQHGEEHGVKGVRYEIHANGRVQHCGVTSHSGMAIAERLHHRGAYTIRYSDVGTDALRHQYTGQVNAEHAIKVSASGLTVFLGGAGMVGDYQQDMVDAFADAGIMNAVYGNYSSLFSGWDKHVSDVVDNLADASAVVFYNQDKNDPIAINLVPTGQCQVDSEKSLGPFVVHTQSGVNSQGEACDKYVVRIELAARQSHYNLAALEVDKPLPVRGQFNLVGYSWGAVIAARTAVDYADQGIKIDHLVLIGAPINQSLLSAVESHANILKVVVINLTEYGDPVYAGMSDAQLLASIFTLASQMFPSSSSSSGHFYYSGESQEGKRRRRILASRLFQEGLR